MNYVEVSLKDTGLRESDGRGIRFTRQRELRIDIDQTDIKQELSLLFKRQAGSCGLLRADDYRFLPILGLTRTGMPATMPAL